MLKIKKTIIVFIAIAFFITNNVNAFTQNQLDQIENDNFLEKSSNSMQLNSISQADLQLILFESWWSPYGNGTLYIRYLVENKGQTYHSENPIGLNISISESPYNESLFYINQSLFFDPYTWYEDETLGGCVQVFNISKPKMIYAIINVFNLVLENNYENNQNSTLVYDGIIVQGYIKKVMNNDLIPILKSQIKRCDSLSLQSNLIIVFSSNETGFYRACLYPDKKNEEFYCLLFSNPKNNNIIYKEIKPKEIGTPIFLNITFQDTNLPTPNRLIGSKVWFKNINYWFITSFRNYNDIKISYKIKWDSDLYSPWIETSDIIHINNIQSAWMSEGLKQLKIIIKDSNGLLSPWSALSQVYII